MLYDKFPNGNRKMLISMEIPAHKRKSIMIDKENKFRFGEN